jgi:hypothetical protein
MEYGATACTDVTGFGLLGHLVEMAKASQVDVTLDLPHIPSLAGVQETIKAGVFSTLCPQNVRVRWAIRNLETVAQAPSIHCSLTPRLPAGYSPACQRAALRRAWQRCMPSDTTVPPALVRCNPFRHLRNRFSCASELDVYPHLTSSYESVEYVPKAEEPFSWQSVKR